MSTGTPEDPAPAGAKKGLPTLAKVGIGCAVLLVLVLITIGVVGYLMKDKVAEFASSYEENPALATATMIEKLGGDIEVVDSDDEAGTVTVRDKKSGQVVTVTLEDIKDGKIEFSTDEGQVVIDGDGEEGGGMRVQSPEGEMRMGGGTIEDLPDWALLDPNARPTDIYTMSMPDQVSGGYVFEVTRPLDAMMDALEEAAEQAGFAVQHRTTSSGPDGEMQMLMAVDEATERHLNITGEGGASECTIHVNYTGKPE